MYILFLPNRKIYLGHIQILKLNPKFLLIHRVLNLVSNMIHMSQAIDQQQFLHFNKARYLINIQ